MNISKKACNTKSGQKMKAPKRNATRIRKNATRLQHILQHVCDTKTETAQHVLQHEIGHKGDHTLVPSHVSDDHGHKGGTLLGLGLS